MAVSPSISLSRADSLRLDLCLCVRIHVTYNEGSTCMHAAKQHKDEKPPRENPPVDSGGSVDLSATPASRVPRTPLQCTVATQTTSTHLRPRRLREAASVSSRP